MHTKTLSHVTDYISLGSCLSYAAFDFAYRPGAPIAIAQTFEEIDDLARYAFSVFRGEFPAVAFSTAWSQATSMPWMKSYLKPAEGVSHWKPIDNEICEIASKLCISHLEEVTPWLMPHFSPLNCPLDKPKETVQWYAVATLLALDKSVDSTLDGNLALAMRWLTWAYKSHLETIKIASPIARNHKRAQIAADASHSGHRAMKAKVFTWLDENFSRCQSKDQATEKILNGKIVPSSHSTVRSWIDDWGKKSFA
jgi:hypothetical protein